MLHHDHGGSVIDIIESINVECAAVQQLDKRAVHQFVHDEHHGRANHVVKRRLVIDQHVANDILGAGHDLGAHLVEYDEHYAATGHDDFHDYHYHDRTDDHRDECATCARLWADGSRVL